MTTKSNTTRRGFSVNVYLPSGDPEGLKVVEKTNWTGRGLVIPRAMFGESKTREELNGNGSRCVRARSLDWRRDRILGA